MVSRLMLFFFGLAALLILLSLRVSGQEPQKPAISLRVYPIKVLTNLGRAEVQVTWNISKHPDNRGYSLSYASDNGDYASSLKTLNGDKEYGDFPECTLENQRPCFRTVKPGMYLFTACVYRMNAKPICVKKEVEVL